MIRSQKGHDEANAAVKRLLHLLGVATQGDGRDIYAKIAANGGGGDGAAVIINATEAGSMRPALKTAEAVGELAVGPVALGYDLHLCPFSIRQPAERAVDLALVGGPEVLHRGVKIVFRS